MVSDFHCSPSRVFSQIRSSGNLQCETTTWSPTVVPLIVMGYMVCGPPFWGGGTTSVGCGGTTSVLLDDNVVVDDDDGDDAFVAPRREKETSVGAVITGFEGGGKIRSLASGRRCDECTDDDAPALSPVAKLFGGLKVNVSVFPNDRVFHIPKFILEVDSICDGAG